MTRLYVEELQATPLEQQFTIDKRTLVSFVRLHICKYLSPTGTFIVQLTTADDTVLATSSQSLATMQAAGDADLSANYFHGFVTFALDKVASLVPGVYKLKLTSSGYMYNANVFLGWCKADEDRAVPVEGDEPLPADSPFDFEMYVLERVR